MADAEIDMIFIEEHLLVLDTHLRLLLQATKDFDSAMKNITTDKFDINLEKDRDKIWNNISQLSDACWRVGQIIKPEPKQLKKDVEPQLRKFYKSFVKKRGEQLRSLLALELSEKKSLNEIRNAAVHVDERLDEWYVRNVFKGQRPKKITLRSLADGESPVLDFKTANLFWFDYNLGVVHHLGSDSPFHLESLEKGIVSVKTGIDRADKFLQLNFENKGRKTLFRVKKTVLD